MKRPHVNTRRRTLSRDLADVLCREIRQKRLKPGTSLGTEADLAERFGVSRTVVREAIGNLRGLGVVASRQGFGLSVANGDVVDTLSRAFVPLVAGREHWPELCHLRFVLEVGSVPLAVERATEAHITRMRELAEEMLRLVRKRSGDSVELSRRITDCEIEFHRLVFEAAGGGLVEQFRNVLVGYFDEAYGHEPYSQLPNAKDMQDHLRLVAAFAARNVGAAVEILADHVRPMIKV